MKEKFGIKPKLFRATSLYVTTKPYYSIRSISIFYKDMGAKNNNHILVKD